LNGNPEVSGILHLEFMTGLTLERCRLHGASSPPIAVSAVSSIDSSR